MQTYTCEVRTIPPAPSDVSVDGPESLPIWLPNGWRHTSRKLWRYRAAAQEAMANRMFLSLAGPDGTKMGADLSIQMGALMNSANGMVCVAPPQVPGAIVLDLCLVKFRRWKINPFNKVCLGNLGILRYVVETSVSPTYLVLPFKLKCV